MIRDDLNTMPEPAPAAHRPGFILILAACVVAVLSLYAAAGLVGYGLLHDTDALQVASARQIDVARMPGRPW